MRITYFVILNILLTLCFSNYAKCYISTYNSNIPISSQVIYDFNDSSKNKQQLAGMNIYKLILSGKENEIKQYFNEVTADELMNADSGAIVKAFNRLSTNDKVSRTIWILEEVKKRTIEVKKYVYTELNKVDYGKPSFFLKHMVNNYFTNYNESEAMLLEKIRRLQKKMSK